MEKKMGNKGKLYFRLRKPAKEMWEERQKQ